MAHPKHDPSTKRQQTFQKRPFVKRPFLLFSFVCTLMVFTNFAQAAESSLRHACDGGSDSSSSSDNSETNEELSQALQDLNSSDFDSAEKRKAKKDRYYQALKKVILETNSGRHLINCFESGDDDRFDNSGFQFLVLEKPFGGTTANYTYVDKPGTPNKYLRQIELSANENPLSAVSFLAHEMEHACHGSETLTTDLEDDIEEREQKALVDEMRSYRLHVDFFAEIVRAEPELVCESTTVKSGLFDGRDLTLQDFLAEVDEALNAGTFYRKVIRHYMRLGLFMLDTSFYNYLDSEDDTPSKRVPRKDLVDKFKEAGYRLVAD